ncbi:MAG: hypothetical protein HY280_10955 [Nitrospinae bacterium]|nr:hypothetical protein [Nitrospinota bacterium]
MKKFLTLFLVAAVALVGGVFAPKSAEAVPAFARQLQISCPSCHYIAFPNLNSFGRSFKLSGFTQAAVETLKDDGLDLPANLNAAVMIGSQLSLGTTSGMNGNNNGNWQIGNDASLFFGGRVSTDMGALIEVNGGGTPGGIIENTKFVISHDFGGVQGGLSLYRTGGGGAAYSIDLFNSGSNQNNYGWSSGKTVQLNQQYGPARGGAEGLHLFAGSSLFFVNVGLFAPVKDNFNAAGALLPTGTGAALNLTGGNGANAGLNLNQYYRVAITPSLGGADLLIGAQLSQGRATLNASANNCSYASTSSPCQLEVETSTTMFDFQAQADVAGNPMQVTAVYGTVPGISSANARTLATLKALQGSTTAYTDAYGGALYNTGSADITGMDISLMYGLTKHLALKALYGSTTNAAGVKSSNITAKGLGVAISLAANVKLTVEEFMFDYSGTKPTAGDGPDLSTTMIDFKYLF